MSVFWLINTEYQKCDQKTIDANIEKIFNEFHAAEACRPRAILMADNGAGAAIRRALVDRGLPVEKITVAQWRQTVEPTDDGPPAPEETCL